MPTGQPNILWICTDQQRWDTLGSYGNAFVQTPHIDALAAGGALFRALLFPEPGLHAQSGQFSDRPLPENRRAAAKMVRISLRMRCLSPGSLPMPAIAAACRASCTSRPATPATAKRPSVASMTATTTTTFTGPTMNGPAGAPTTPTGPGWPSRASTSRCLPIHNRTM